MNTSTSFSSLNSSIQTTRELLSSSATSSSSAPSPKIAPTIFSSKQVHDVVGQLDMSPLLDAIRGKKNQFSAEVSSCTTQLRNLQYSDGPTKFASLLSEYVTNSAFPDPKKSPTQKMTIDQFVLRVQQQCITDLTAIFHQNMATYRIQAARSPKFAQTVTSIMHIAQEILPEIRLVPNWIATKIVRSQAPKILGFEHIPLKTLVDTVLTSCAKIIESNTTSNTFLEIPQVPQELKTIETTARKNQAGLSSLIEANILSIINNIALALKSSIDTTDRTGSGLCYNTLLSLEKALQTTSSPIITQEAIASRCATGSIDLCLPNNIGLIIGADEEANQLATSFSTLLPTLMNNIINSVLSSLETSIAPIIKPLIEDQEDLSEQSHPLHKSHMPLQISLNQSLPNYARNIFLALKEQESKTSCPANASYLSKAKFHIVKSMKLGGYLLIAKVLPPLLRWKAKDSSTIVARIQYMARRLSTHQFDVLDAVLNTFDGTSNKKLLETADLSHKKTV